MTKQHFTTDNASPVCHLTKGRVTGVARAVTCGSCQRQPAFLSAKASQAAAAEAAFHAQTPHTVVPQFGRVNAQGVMDCYSCGGTLWRERPRSLWSFHYVCAGCGTSVHPMTETGMRVKATTHHWADRA